MLEYFNGNPTALLDALPSPKKANSPEADKYLNYARKLFASKPPNQVSCFYHLNLL